MDATTRRARAAQLDALPLDQAFLMLVTWLVNAAYDLVTRADALALDGEPWRPLTHTQDALLGVLVFHLGGDELTAARLDHAVRVERRPIPEACHDLARDLRDEADLQDAFPAVNVPGDERLDATGWVLNGLEAQRMPAGTALVRCDEAGAPVAGSTVVVVPRDASRDAAVMPVGTRDQLEAMRYLVARDGRAAGVVLAGGAR